MIANQDFITSPCLQDFQHGFFTRAGGVSQGIYAGLNCGRGSNDDLHAVDENRNRVATTLGIMPTHLVSVHQHHSPDVIQVNEPLTQSIKADGMVTKTKGVALGVLSADCQPILFADPTHGVIGACHAGWKGAAAGVIQNTVQAMVDIGAKRENISAAIGPCISQTNYEVGPDFETAVCAAMPSAASLFITGATDRLHFDLPAFGLHCLRHAGIQRAHWTGHCTYAEPSRFFSYRRSCHTGESDYGRLIAAITL